MDKLSILANVIARSYHYRYRYRQRINVDKDSEEQLAGIAVSPGYVPSLHTESDRSSVIIAMHNHYEKAVKYELIFVNKDEWIRFYLSDIYIYPPFLTPLQQHNEMINSAHYFRLYFDSFYRYSLYRFFIKYTGNVLSYCVSILCVVNILCTVEKR